MNKEFSVEELIEQLKEDVSDKLLPIPSFGERNFSHYMVDLETSIIFSLKFGKLIALKTKPHHKTGYHHITIMDDDKKPFITVLHRIIWAAYVGHWDWVNDPDNEINHIDMDKSNNHYTNLEQCDRRSQYSLEVRKLMSEKKQGSNHPLAKLNEDKVKYILREWEDWQEDKMSDFIKDMMIMFNVDYSVIWAVINRRNWTHVVV